MSLKVSNWGRKHRPHLQPDVLVSLTVKAFCPNQPEQSIPPSPLRLAEQPFDLDRISLHEKSISEI